MSRYDDYELTIEERAVYVVTKEDVKWTDAEWDEACRAAIDNDPLHEAWEVLPRECIADGEIDEVRARKLPTPVGVIAS